MADGFAKTPHYVLKEGAIPICPSVVQTSSGIPTVVIYGFSDKPEYDVFLSTRTLALTPYPLVKRFLMDKIEIDGSFVKLIVLDAASSTERCLYAATFQTVLESFQLGSESVAVSHRLVLEASSSCYRVEAFSPLVAVQPSTRQT